MKKIEISQLNVIALILGIIVITVISQIALQGKSNEIDSLNEKFDQCQVELRTEVEQHKLCSLAIDGIQFELDACHLRDEEYTQIINEKDEFIDAYKELEEQCLTWLDLMREGCYPE